MGGQGSSLARRTAIFHWQKCQLQQKATMPVLQRLSHTPDYRGILLAGQAVSTGSRISVRRVQKYKANTALVAARAAPNSVVYQRVDPVLRIKLSEDARNEEIVTGTGTPPQATRCPTSALAKQALGLRRRPPQRNSRARTNDSFLRCSPQIAITEHAKLPRRCRSTSSSW